MDKKSFLAVLFVAVLYALYSFSKFKTESFEYNAGNLIDIDKKALKIEKKPPILSKNLSDYEVWGVKKEEKKKKVVKKAKKIKKAKPKKLPDVVKIQRKNSLYNVCIKKRCYELLGIAGGYVVFYDAKNKKYLKLKRGEMIENRVEISKITPDEVKIFDNKDKKEFAIEYFKVDIKKYSPKEKKR